MRDPILRPISELSTTDHAYRRRAGVILALAFGAVYGVTSQAINHIAMPGVPLYQPPLGPVANAVLCIVAGLALGAVTVWPTNALLGVFLSSGLGATAVILVSLVMAKLSPKALPGVVIGGAFLVLPLLGMFVPLLAVFRWVVHREEEQRRERRHLLVRFVAPFILGLIVAGAASTVLYRPDARVILQRMHVLIEVAQTTPPLPDALQTPEVGDFSARARGAYTLEWTNANLNRFRIPRPLARFDQHSVAVARFANGWVLACLFVAPDWEPICQGY